LPIILPDAVGYQPEVIESRHGVFPGGSVVWVLVEENEDSRSGVGAPDGDLEQEVAGLYAEHAVRLLRYAETLGRNPDMGRDAVQEIFLRYFAERRYGNQVENPRAWLYRVLHNHLLDRLDRAAMKREVSAEGADEVLDGCVDAETRLEQIQTAQEIASRLTPRELDCLRLRVEGLSYQEIAQVLGIRPGTVAALLPRVYAKLRDVAAEGISLSENTVGAIGLLLRGGQTHSS
jgi:RNA polymerase sigma-70 factor (ECF subfamily)